MFCLLVIPIKHFTCDFIFLLYNDFVFIFFSLEQIYFPYFSILFFVFFNYILFLFLFSFCDDLSLYFHMKFFPMQENWLIFLYIFFENKFFFIFIFYVNIFPFLGSLRFYFSHVNDYIMDLFWPVYF